MRSKDDFGNRIKQYESHEVSSFMRGIPLIIRLDGRCFSKFTSDFDRPFDNGMSDSMLETTKFLVDETNALFGYTQSDEITLLLHVNKPKSELLFAGKKFKILSNTASLASVKFYTEIIKHKPKLKKLPSFDARAFQVPSKIEAWNVILWRVQDAVRNSIQSLAQANFNHKRLQNKNQYEIQELLSDEKDIIWDDLPSKYKEGRFVKRVQEIHTISPEEIKRHGSFNSGMEVTRNVIKEIELPCYFKEIDNRVEFLFDNEEIIVI